MHDKGNEENVFDRVDYQISNADSLHTNLQFTRSWFQTPNSFDQQNATAWNCQVVDHNATRSANGAACWSRGPALADQDLQHCALLDPRAQRLTTLFTLGAFVRHDEYNYYPSGNPFADLSPDLQSETVGQYRTLTNAGLAPTSPM